MLGKIDCHGLSDIGRVRQSNEDQFLVANLTKSMLVHQTSLGLDEQTHLFGTSLGRLLLVADGMGGHAAGKRASALAVDSLTAYVLNTMHWFFRLRQDDEEQFLDDLKHALAYCQERVRAEGERVPGRRGMGTTLTMAYLIWPRLYVVHAGDSRCYLLRKGRLRQITRDHTVAQRLADEGALDDPETSRWSHVLWNVVGGDTDELLPEVYRADLELGDTLLLCTDGLTRHVHGEQLARLLGEDQPSAETCRRLVDAANAGGGSDNVTVVVAHLRDVKHQESVERAAATAAAEPAVGKAPAPVVPTPEPLAAPA